MIFSAGEMRRRVDWLRSAMSERSIDLVLVHSADNVYYLSGLPLLDEWGRPMWFLMSSDGDATMIGAMIERENMAAHTWVDQVQLFEDLAQSLDAALQLAVSFGRGAGRKTSRIGIERSVMSLRVWDALSIAFPDSEFVDVGDTLAEARITKSDEELELLRLGGEIAKIGADTFLNALKEGTTEISVAAAATYAMERATAGLSSGAGTSTYTYCQVGTNTLTPHLHPTSRRIRRGDIIALNCFPVIWGYCVELERTFVFGQPNDVELAALRAVNDAFEATKAAFRPGAHFAELDDLSRRILTDHGYGGNIRHGTGHAHGIMIGATAREELGEIRSYNQGVVRERMANSIEPGIYLEDIGGFRHSDVMIATVDGAVCITDFPRDIGLS
jgi:Xaa-Pro aminopeptidase